MIDNKLIDLSKKGTIILTHYRSGGTQLRRILVQYCNNFNIENKDVGEIDLDILSDKDYSEQLQYLFEPDTYYIVQLNNPMTISLLYSNGKFEELSSIYNIVYLERKNKRNSILSMPIWEELIDSKLFPDSSKWTEENMKNFHDKLLKKQLSHWYVYLGLPHNMNFEPKEQYLNNILMYYTQLLALTRYLKSEYKLYSIYYEDYEEYNDTFFEQHFKSNFTEEFKKLVKSTYKSKIPYHNKDFSIYFDEFTNKTLNYWNIK